MRPLPIATEQLRKSNCAIAVMLSTFIYGVGTGALGLVDPNVALAVSYAIALALGLRAWILTRHQPGPTRVSPGILLVLLFMGALWVATFFVQVSDIRIDEVNLPQQVLLLSLAIVPAFPAYRVASRMSVAPALMLSAHLVAAIGIASVLLDASSITKFETYGSRSFGFLSDPVAITLTYPLAVYAASRRWLLLALVGFALVATVSRGPLFVAAAIIIQLVFASRGRALVQSLLIVPLLVLMLFFTSGRFGILVDRYASRDEGRLLTPLEGLRIFTESPIFGYGYNAIGYFHPTIKGYDRLGVFSTASSPMVQMLSDGGLLLFLPYLFVAIAISMTVVRNVVGWRSSQAESAMAGAGAWLVAIVWVSQSSTWFVIGNFMTPLLFGVMGAVLGAAERRRRFKLQETKYAAFP